MKAKILLETEICNSCPYHEEHRISTADDFETEFGIYCSLTKDTTDSFERYTYSGKVNKRLVHSYEPCESEKASVPAWCPFLIKEYQRVIEKLTNTQMQYYMAIDKKVINMASSIINALANNRFSDFIYSGALHNGSTERDICLIKIAQLYKNQYINTGIDGLGLGTEDTRIIEAAAKIPTDANCADLVAAFDQEKSNAKDAQRKPILNSSMAVQAAIYLADTIIGLIPQIPHHSNAELVFVERGEDKNNKPLPIKTIEIHYTIDGLEKDYHPVSYHSVASGNKEGRNIIRQYSMITDFFGIKTVKYFVNGKQIGASKVKEAIEENT